MDNSTTTTSITFEEFRTRFIEKKEKFTFALENIKFKFFYQSPEYILIVSDEFRDKVYHSTTSEMIDKLSINGVKISELWSKFKLL